MKTTRPLLICITGPDGSGKSTACAGARALLEDRLGQGSVVEVSVWDSLVTSGGITPAFESQEDAARYLGDLDGPSRTLFILHAMSRALQLAKRREGARVLLLNGYWFKYAVSEIGYGVSLETVLGAAAGFSAPDEVFFLEIDPETAWARRGRASAYEQGPGASSQEQVGRRFIEFQTRLGEAWRKIESLGSVRWQHLSARQAPEELSARIASAVTARLAEFEEAHGGADSGGECRRQPGRAQDATAGGTKV